MLLQLGLTEEWWADSVECLCYLRNIQDKLSDRKTPCERRSRMPFNGPLIPFGAKDAAAARGLALRSGSGAIKHMDTRYFWLQQKEKNQELRIEKIRGTVNPQT